jgi:hypothetical protein
MYYWQKASGLALFWEINISLMLIGRASAKNRPEIVVG